MGEHKKDRRGGDADVESTTPLPPPTNRKQVRSADQPSQTDATGTVPTQGSKDRQEGGEGGSDEGEVGQSHFHPHLDIEVTVGSGPGQEGSNADGGNIRRVHPSPSTPILHSGEPEGT